MAAATSSFGSLTGRRGVDIGTSFTRAWKERTGKTTNRSKDYPNPEYYSLRYKFKPESIDNDGAGSLTPKDGEGHVFELELPSQQGDSHRFTAVEQPSKEWECVLLWDPATQQLTLEKLESTLNLSYDGRGKGSIPTSGTPPAVAGPSRTKRPSHTSSSRSQDRDFEADLERPLTGHSDAEGEPDDDMDIQAEIEAMAGMPTMQEEEEDEDEDEMEPVELEPPPPPPPIKPKAPHRVPVKLATKAKSKARARPSISASAKREVDGIEEEELNFGEPTKRTRHPRRSSAANIHTIATAGHNSTGLALPAAPTPNRHAPPTPSDLLQPPSTATHIPYAGSETGTESDESDEGGAVDDEGGAVDAAAWALEMEMSDEEDEGIEVKDIESEGEQHNAVRPLSLNELAGGKSEDDDTTSDDSSDDD